MRILRLTLKRKWFDMIASGEKKEEYRNPSLWILSRIKGKTYDVVEFRNGYAADSPIVRCEYKGWHMGDPKPEWSGNSKERCLVVIKLGDLIK